MSKKILVTGLYAGVAMLVVGLVLNWVFGYVFSLGDAYQNANLFRPWSDPLMNLYFLYPFLLGVVLAWFWHMINEFVVGKTPLERAYRFALVYFIIAGIPGMFVTYSSFQVSLVMVISWLLSGFVQAVVAGFIFAKKNP